MSVKITNTGGAAPRCRPGQPKVATFKIRAATAPSIRRNPGRHAGHGRAPPAACPTCTRRIATSTCNRAGVLAQPQRRQAGPRRRALAGQHRITGDGIPASMQFQVEQDADFMPKLMLRAAPKARRRTPSTSAGHRWIARALLHHRRAHADAGRKLLRRPTIWRTAPTCPAPAATCTRHLSGSFIDKWLKQKVLPASATSCTIPKGIFAGASNAQGQQAVMPGMLMMTAYGPERTGSPIRPSPRIPSSRGTQVERAPARQVHRHRDAGHGHGRHAATGRPAAATAEEARRAPGC